MSAEIPEGRQDSSLNSWISQKYYKSIIYILFFKIFGINVIANAGELLMSFPLGQVPGVDSPQKGYYRYLHSGICSDPLHVEAGFGVFGGWSLGVLPTGQ